MANARSLSPSELIQKANEAFDVLLSFGDDMPQIVSELRSMQTSLTNIGVIVLKHLKGHAAKLADSHKLEPITVDAEAIKEIVANDPSLREKNREAELAMKSATAGDPTTVVAASDAGLKAAPTGPVSPHKGPFLDIIMMLIQNPQLITLIMSLFKK